MVLEAFSGATFSVGQNTWIEPPSSAGGPFQTASFYLDSSGRSKVDLPLLLNFSSPQALQLFLATNCVQPTHSASPPKGSDTTTKHDEQSSTDPSRFSFGIEAKVSMTSGSGEAVSATVESVAISSSRVGSNGDVLHLETQTVLRVSRLEDDVQSTSRLESSSLNGVRVLLEITACLSEKSDLEDRAAAASNGLRAVYLGRYADLGKTSARRVVHHRLKPPTIGLQVKLSHAFSITARSIRGTSGGETLVSLGICHSNTHAQEVVVSNLALHPAFSRSLKSGLQSDQSAAVQWSFVPGSQLQLPLKIRPNEAYATILHVLGSSETGQAFLSPLSATAAVDLGQSTTVTNAVAAVDVEWVSASQVPTNASDALRITVTVDQQDYKVGAPFAVKLTVHNLGQTTASNLKVGHRTTDSNDFQVLWTPPNVATNNGLLEVDDALPLGEIRSRESTETVLRLIPLDTGTLALPQFEIFNGNKTYRCAHNVQIVATL
jgi:hypothetical protein